MKIDCYLVMRNEAKMLPYFFRHYNQFVTRYFIYDDSSDDGSVEIINAEPKATIFPVAVSGLDDVYFCDVYSGEYKKHSTGQCDFVFVVAADEFLYHPNMAVELQEIHETGFGVIQTKGYQMLSESFPVTEGQIYHEVNKGIFDPRYSLSVIFRPDVDIRFAPGREGFTTSDSQKPYFSDIQLLHYRFLSEEYVKSRHAVNFSRLTPNNRQHGLGTHTDPGYQGPYDLKWYKQSLEEAKPCLGSK